MDFENIIKENDKIIKNNNINIDSIFIEKDEKIYKKFYKNEELHELRSCSKLLISMAIGIAIDKKMKINEKIIDVNTKIYPVIKDIIKIEKEENLNKIKKWTIKNLLTHTTGYEKQMMSTKDIKEINKKDLINYVLNYNIPYEVGKRFAYNNAEPFILSVFFQEAFKMNLVDFIKENIFDKIGVKEFKWENYDKYCPGATGLYLKHSDFHKIGKLLLENGKYNNKQIISEEWINEIMKMQIEIPELVKKDRVFQKIGIGYYTFISNDGYVFRDGSNGQYIIINRAKKLLITIMSTEKEMKKITDIFRGII